MTDLWKIPQILVIFKMEKDTELYQLIAVSYLSFPAPWLIFCETKLLQKEKSRVELIE